MKLIKQIGIVFGICWLSQCIEYLLPVAFPASVIGLILMLILLLVKVLRVEQIKDLPFLFVPAVTGIMNYVDVITANLLPFVTVCWVSLLLTYGATVWAVKLTMTLVKKKEGKK